MRRESIRSVSLAGLLAIVVGVLAAGTVLAHAEVARANPTPDAVVSTPPAKVRIWFTEPIEAPPNALRIVGPDGQRVDRGDARVAPDDVMALEASLDADAQGTYIVQWQVVSADSHPVSGAYQFSVGAPSSTGASAVSVGAPSAVPLQAVGRWLHLLGLVIAIGPLIFGLLVLDSRRDRALDRLPWIVSRAGGWLLIVTAPLMLLAQAVGIGGTLADAVRSDILRGVLLSRWGGLWITRLGLAILLLVLVALALRRGAKAPLSRAWSALGLAIGVPLLVATSLNGHPASTEPVWLTVLIDGVHLAATAAWIGGLLTLGVAVLPAIRGRPASERVGILSRIAPRFSTLALVSVELLVLTGLYSAWAQVENPVALVATSYGQALLVKLGLVVVVLGFAAVQLLVLRPRIAGIAHDAPRVSQVSNTIVRRFGQLVGVEALLGIAILAVVGVLTSLAPARGSASAFARATLPTTPAVTLAQNAGPTLVTLGIEPAGLGPNRVTVTLRDLYGEPIRDARVRLRTRPPEESGAAPSVTTMAVEDGAYRASVSLAPAGRWQLEVLVAQSGQAEVGAPFELSVPVLGARELLVLADQTMNRLQSLVEYNELTDGGAVVKTRYEFLAPDRMYFQLESPAGDAESYAIGKTRYIRSGDEPWKAEPWPTDDGFRWPNYRFAENATEVTLLGREPMNGTECFVVSFYEPRSEARYRMWIGTNDYRVYHYVMMAPAHYMTSTFSNFDEPLTIEAPTRVQGQ